MLLEIKNLDVSIDDKTIIKSLNLEINPGEVHIIMGQNGAGKSTLANIIAGREGYTIKNGGITYQGEDLLTLPVEERARKGIFLAFQYPVEIPGVSSMNFIKESLNAIRKSQGLEEVKPINFLKDIRNNAKKVALDEALLKRSINTDFSGGEKKRLEALQLLMLKPKLVLLDETDSGLDVDALKIITSAINSMRNSERSFVIITHYHNLLKYIPADKIHVFADGKIIKSGDISLAIKIEEKGYDSIKNT